jgi:GNAT superfamily N-acetyltransferase
MIPDPAIRPCTKAESLSILAIVNGAAEAYRGVIPADRWHEPYMSRTELEREVAAGVGFWGYHENAALAGVMGVQPVLDVTLIRHAYVLPAHQGKGIGGALLHHLLGNVSSQVLVGTWAAASWAIAFYERHNFSRVPRGQIAKLLKTYWNIPERQIETSVVLANPPLREA